MARLILASVALALAMAGVPAEAKKKPKPVPAAPVPPPPSVKQGVELWQAGDYAAAVAMWQPFADAGDPDAMFNIGQAYKLGRSVPKDSLIARDWYRKAAAKGHLPAEANLGILLFQAGEKPEAVKWLKMAADQNEMRAQYVLGVAAWNGDGIPKNLALAYAYLSRSAAQGLPDAQGALNSLTGVIGPVDRANGWAGATSLAAGKGLPPNLGGGPPVTYAGSYERFNPENVQKPAPRPEVVTAQAVPVTPASAPPPPVTASMAAPKPAPPAVATVVPPPAVQKPAPPPPAPVLAATEAPPKPQVAAAVPPKPAPVAPPPVPKPVPEAKPVAVAAAPVAAPPKPAERPLAPPVTTVAIPAAEPPKPVEPAARPAPAKVEVAKAEPPKPAPAKPKPVETAAAEPPPKPKPTGWRVQLGAFSERQKAEAAWSEVKTKQKALVANTKPIYEASGSVTKLQIGPYPTKSAAKDACAKIAFSGRACFVTEG